MAKHRSPAYPAVNLEQAIVYARSIYDADRRNQVPVGVAIEHLGYTDGSSQGMRAIAALTQFGLLEQDGKKEDRRVRLTERALDILIAPSDSHPPRIRAIQEAALLPTLHAELWNGGRSELPSDATLRANLVRHNEFNENYVDRFIRQFRDTIQFAGLLNSDTISHDEDDDDFSEEPASIEVNTYVQWTSRGVDQFDTPKKVVHVDGEWAFVEGSPTGVPVSELTVADPPAPVRNSGGTPPVNPYFVPPKPTAEEPAEGVALDRTTLDEGAVRLEWPDKLSKDSVAEFQDWMIGRINRARRKAGLDKIQITDPKPSNQQKAPVS